MGILPLSDGAGPSLDPDEATEHLADPRCDGTAMMRAFDRSSPLLAIVDALCEELSASCGLTRFSIVLARRPIPVTISYEDVRHANVPLAPTAYLELDITDGSRCIGYVTLENSLAADYPSSARASASAAVHRHAPLLRRVLGSDNPSFPSPGAGAPTPLRASGRLRAHG